MELKYLANIIALCPSGCPVCREARDRLVPKEGEFNSSLVLEEEYIEYAHQLWYRLNGFPRQFGYDSEYCITTSLNTQECVKKKERTIGDVNSTLAQTRGDNSLFINWTAFG